MRRVFLKPRQVRVFPSKNRLGSGAGLSKINPFDPAQPEYNVFPFKYLIITTGRGGFDFSKLKPHGLVSVWPNPTCGHPQAYPSWYTIHFYVDYQSVGSRPEPPPPPPPPKKKKRPCKFQILICFSLFHIKAKLFKQMDQDSM